MHCVGLQHKPDVKSRGRYGLGRYETSAMQLCHDVRNAWNRIYKLRKTQLFIEAEKGNSLLTSSLLLCGDDHKDSQIL